MMTEAASKIPVPSWWRGGATVSDAMLAADRFKEAKK
jgi:hypothetical protein